MSKWCLQERGTSQVGLVLSMKSVEGLLSSLMFCREPDAQLLWPHRHRKQLSDGPATVTILPSSKGSSDLHLCYRDLAASERPSRPRSPRATHATQLTVLGGIGVAGAAVGCPVPDHAAIASALVWQLLARPF